MNTKEINIGNSLEWFKDRIGKTIYRDRTSCPCEICEHVYKNGVMVIDDAHAQYLYDCQNELQINYRDESNTGI